MNALERIAAILRRARIAGGWIDETVAEAVLEELGLDEDGDPVGPIDNAPTSPNLGHG